MFEKPGQPMGGVNQPQQPSNNLGAAMPRPVMPAQPESATDIFADIGSERVSSGGPLRPSMSPSEGGRGRRIILIILIIVIVILLGVGGVLAYLSFMVQPADNQNQVVNNNNVNVDNQNLNTNDNTNINDNLNTNDNTNINDNLNTNTNFNDNTNLNDNTNSQPARDSDSDGLSDEQEMNLGTDPLNMDTDNDGLFDGDEYNMWNTNPLVADSDSDGYNDGDEVKAGYNPNGPGQLVPPTE